MAKNVLEQLKDLFTQGVKSVISATPPGQAFNAYRQAQQAWDQPKFQAQIPSSLKSIGNVAYHPIQTIQPKLQQFQQQAFQGIKDLPASAKITATNTLPANIRWANDVFAPALGRILPVPTEYSGVTTPWKENVKPTVGKLVAGNIDDAMMASLGISAPMLI